MMHGNSLIPSDKRFDAYHTARLCQSCMESMTAQDLAAEREHEDCLCRDCRAVQAELDLDDGWGTYLASLKPHAVVAVVQIDKGLAGWKCMGGTMTFEQDTKGRRSVATAKDFRFLAPGHKVEAVFGVEGLTLRNHNESFADWSVTFPFETPIPVILAAAIAAVTSS